MHVIKDDTMRIPIKCWASHIEDGAIEQAKNVARLPFVRRHVALAPDSHQGFGICIGAIFGAKDVVIPNAVGVDVSCGIYAVKTNIYVDKVPTELLKQIIGDIRQVIPVGMNHHKIKQDYKLMPEGYSKCAVVYNEYENARSSLGTLGGGK